MESDYNHIFIIDDNNDDIDIIQDTLKEAGVTNPVHVFKNADSALAYLKLNGNVNDDVTSDERPRPSLILLDLNLPGTDGKEALKLIKESKNKSVPIIILTTSTNRKDVEYCYDNGANSYLVKPDTYTGYISAFEDMKKWWLEDIQLP